MNLPPVLRQVVLGTNGQLLSGGKIYTYQSGTTTPQATYTDSSGGTPNANPIILDANGECNMWLDPSLSYKFIYKDSSDVTLKTVDSVIGLLTANSVGTASIQDLAVTTAKLAANAVTSAKLASDAVTDANRAVQTDHIRDAQITKAKLAVGAKDLSVVSVSTTYPIVAGNELVLCDATSAAFTVTLPTAASVAGRTIKIKKTDSTLNQVTIATTSSQTIDGVTTRKICTQYESITMASDGSNWQIVDRRIPSIRKSDLTWTPTNYGTVTNSNFWYHRDGERIVGGGGFQAGVSAAATGYIALPTGILIDTARYAASTSNQILGLYFLGAGRAILVNGDGGPIFYDGSTNNQIYLTHTSSGSPPQGLIKENASASAGSNIEVMVNFEFFVSGWEG